MMRLRLKRREKGPPVDCVNERTCGATSIYGFEVRNRDTNCIIVVCLDCARRMAHNPQETRATDP